MPRSDFEQMELYGASGLRAFLAQIRSDALRRLYRGLLLEALYNRSCVSVIEPSGTVFMTASMKKLAERMDCSARTVQRYRARVKEEGLDLQDHTVNTDAEWKLNLHEVLPPFWVDWFVEAVDRNNLEHHFDPAVAPTAAVAPTECRPDTETPQRVVAPTGCRPDEPLPSENTAESPADSPDSPYVMTDVTSAITSTSLKEPRGFSLPAADLKYLTETFKTAHDTKTTSLGVAAQKALRGKGVEVGQRAFNLIDFADVLQIAGLVKGPDGWSVGKRRKIVLEYFVDAVAARRALKPELRLFVEVFCMAARRRPEAPSEGDDERGGYLRRIWDNRARPGGPAITKSDKRVTIELFGEGEISWK